MKIIAFGYKKGRGKDTAAQFVVDWIKRHKPELRVQVIGFADKVKDVAHQLYGWAGLQPGDYYESHRDEKELMLPRLDKSPRDLYIGVGNLLRAVHPGTWVDYLLEQLTSNPEGFYAAEGKPMDVCCVKDLGYPNEAEALRSKGAVLVKLVREGDEASDGRETSLDSWTDWDYVIDNNGTLHDLYGRVAKICGEHLK